MISDNPNISDLAKQGFYVDFAERAAHDQKVREIVGERSLRELIEDPKLLFKAAVHNDTVREYLRLPNTHLDVTVCNCQNKKNPEIRFHVKHNGREGCVTLRTARLTMRNASTNELLYVF